MIQCHALADQNGHVVRFVYQLLLARGLLLLYLGSLCVQRAASGTCRGGLLCYVMLPLYTIHSQTAVMVVTYSALVRSHQSTYGGSFGPVPQTVEFTTHKKGNLR